MNYMKSNFYKINNSLERIYRDQYSLFLDRKELRLIKSKLRKNEYNLYYLYDDSDKVIIYKKNLPNIKVFKIETREDLRHQDILGTIFSLGIDTSYIGDIIKYKNYFYIYVLEEMSEFLKNNLTLISFKPVKLKEIEKEELDNYKREYEEIKLIVSSLRIDNVISRLVNLSRNGINEKIKNKEIILNYEVLTKSSHILRENDVFSIRKYGKYKYVGINKNTKKDNFIINLLKYK